MTAPEQSPNATSRVIPNLPTRYRKVRKMRGSRTHGWGVSGQHRDSGSQGGRGGAGRLTHKRTRLIAEGVSIAKHGFVSHSRRTVRTINVRDLAGLVPEPSDAKSKDELPLIDLSKLGYDKLLGKGVLDRPIELKVARLSESAAKKVEAAGGKIVRLK